MSTLQRWGVSGCASSVHTEQPQEWELGTLRSMGPLLSPQGSTLPVPDGDVPLDPDSFPAGLALGGPLRES